MKIKLSNDMYVEVDSLCYGLFYKSPKSKTYKPEGYYTNIGHLFNKITAMYLARKDMEVSFDGFVRSGKRPVRM